MCRFLGRREVRGACRGARFPASEKRQGTKSRKARLGLWRLTGGSSGGRRSICHSKSDIVVVSAEGLAEQGDPTDDGNTDASGHQGILDAGGAGPISKHS
jgi:hypothetical protein